MSHPSLEKYLRTSRKRYDPTASILGLGGILCVIYSINSGGSGQIIWEVKSLLIVFGGTFASILFQFDFMSSLQCISLVFKSLLGTPDKPLLAILGQLDEAIINKINIVELRDGSEPNGEILNDVVYMYSRGLLYEEIQEFLNARIAAEFLERKVAVDLLRRGAIIAPALGLFGTVMGLIGVLKTLSDPTQIGPSMSLALLTTAYGAGLGSLVFTPLSGRLDHHNTIFIEFHEQLMGKIGIILHREDRDLSLTNIPEETEG